MLVSTIRLRMNDIDFEYLAFTTMKWRDGEWSSMDGRFASHRDTEIVWDYIYALWFDAWPNVLIARAYLEDLREPHQVLRDNEDGNFVITTNYMSPTWQVREGMFLEGDK